MAQASRIEWTGYTWNPVSGCTKISSGCQNCYAERMARRLKKMGNERYSRGFQLRIHFDLLNIPLKWKKPRLVFVNSMSDLFHDDVPDSFIVKTFNVMNKSHQHTFQILTKRSKRLLKMSKKLDWTNNIWMGVTVEDKDNIYRIDHLRECNAKVKFLSCEPLLGSVRSMNIDNLDWVIVGGESGPNARLMKKEWVIVVRDQCIEKGVPYFFKQWGGLRKKAAGRLLDGKTWNQMPTYNYDWSKVL